MTGPSLHDGILQKCQQADFMGWLQKAEGCRGWSNMYTLHVNCFPITVEGLEQTYYLQLIIVKKAEYSRVVPFADGQHSYRWLW